MEVMHGILDDDVVCEHKCNEPLCLRVGSDHLVRSTYSENVRFAVALGRLSGHTLLDGTGRPRCDRSLAICNAFRYGYDEDALFAQRPNRAGTGHTFVTSDRCVVVGVGALSLWLRTCPGDRLFGWTFDQNRAIVCAVGAESDPRSAAAAPAQQYFRLPRGC